MWPNSYPSSCYRIIVEYSYIALNPDVWLQPIKLWVDKVRPIVYNADAMTNSKLQTTIQKITSFAHQL